MANAGPLSQLILVHTDATLMASPNGNLMQWVVVQWTGTTTPPSDLVLEVFLQ